MFAHFPPMSRSKCLLPAFNTSCQGLAAFLAVAAFAFSALVAQEPPALEESQANESQANEEHLKTLAARVGRLSMRYATSHKPAALQLFEHPVMRTGNKEGNRDGGVWLWLDGKRPVAALCVWNRGPLWYSENSALVEDALEVTGWPKAAWHSTGTERKSLALPDPVPQSPAGRQRALRALALEFTAREDRLGIKSELRLLPRPIHTYNAGDHDALDGAIFAFVYGTDPEILMQIEALQNAGAKHWAVHFARMASAELSVRLRDNEVWSALPISKDVVVKTTADYCIIREDP